MQFSIAIFMSEGERDACQLSGLWKTSLVVHATHLTELAEFTQTNISGFKKILGKFNKHFKSVQKSPCAFPSNQGVSPSLPSKAVVEVRKHGIALNFNNGRSSQVSSFARFPELPIRSDLLLQHPCTSLSTEGKPLRALILCYKIATTEKDKSLRHQIRRVQLSRIYC
jgi:hypothetical protein